MTAKRRRKESESTRVAAKVSQQPTKRKTMTETSDTLKTESVTLAAKPTTPLLKGSLADSQASTAVKKVLRQLSTDQKEANRFLCDIGYITHSGKITKRFTTVR